MNKVFKTLLLIVCLQLVVFITSCSKQKTMPKELHIKDTKSFSTLAKGNRLYDKQYSYTTDFDISTFTSNTSSLLFDNENNYIYSPISLYMVLSMIANGASNNTYNELVNVLNCNSLTLSNLNNSLNKILKNNNFANERGSVLINNSLWINKDSSIYPKYIDDISNSYCADIYHTSFNNEGINNIVKWINHYTNDFLHIKPSDINIDNNTRISTINSIYFFNKWDTDFKKSNTYSGLFNEEVETSFMRHTISNRAYINDEVTIVEDRFYNGYTIKYIMPTDSDLVSLLNQGILEKDVKLYGEKEEYDFFSIDLSVPKFSISSSFDFKKTLQSLGVTTLFEMNADLSNMSSKPLYFQSITQNAKIELNEEGAKIAAVTIGVAKDSAPMPPKKIELNKPFIYVVKDVNGIELFTGVYNKVE